MEANSRLEAIKRWVPRRAVCMEIGVWRAEFSKLLLENFVPSEFYAVDPWEYSNLKEHESAWYGAGSNWIKSQEDMNEVFLEAQRILRDSATPATQVHVFRGKTQQFVPDQELDFVYVDGDHRYEGVKIDLEFAWRHLRAGGIAVLDDFRTDRWWGDSVVRASIENVTNGRFEYLESASHQVVLRKAI